MTTKLKHIILKISGISIMLLAFLVVPDNKPWYYEVLLFDVGLLLVLIPKFPKQKKRFSKIKMNL